MVGLARAIYNPRPGELAGELRQPKELCDPHLADRAAVESLLFDAFIPAAYRHDPTNRWKALDAEKWLAFLARYLDDTIASPNLAWWQLPLAVPGVARRFGLMGGLMAGVVAGVVAGMGYGVAYGMAYGAVVGAVIGVMIGVSAVPGVRRSPGPSRGIHWRPTSLDIPVLAFFAGFGALIGVLAGFRAGAWAGAIAAVVCTAVGVAWIWLDERRSVPLDVSSAASPRVALARDRKAGIVIALVTGIGTGALLAVLGVLGTLTRGGAGAGVWAGAWGWAEVGAFVGVLRGLRVAWPYYAMARTWLALHRRLPWPLMGFLADAHRRGVLRQAGMVYQFRHIELQHRLAARPEPPSNVVTARST